jgi:hypothetical protein
MSSTNFTSIDVESILLRNLIRGAEAGNNTVYVKGSMKLMPDEAQRAGAFTH